MKTLFAISLIIPLMGGFFYTKSSGSNKKPEGAVVRYEYGYSNTMAYPITFYKVYQDESGAVRIAWLKDHGPEVQVIIGPQDVLERIADIAAQYKLHRIKRSYYPSVEVLDGTSWHCYIGYEKGSISSDGSNAVAPEKRMNGIYAINAYLQSLIDAAPESTVVFRQDFRDFLYAR